MLSIKTHVNKPDRRKDQRKGTLKEINLANQKKESKTKNVRPKVWVSGRKPRSTTKGRGGDWWGIIVNRMARGHREKPREKKKNRAP